MFAEKLCTLSLLVGNKERGNGIKELIPKPPPPNSQLLRDFYTYYQDDIEMITVKISPFFSALSIFIPSWFDLIISAVPFLLTSYELNCFPWV